MRPSQTARVDAFIRDTLHQQGYPPSFDETLSRTVGRPSRLDDVGRACCLRQSQVLTSLMQLERAGRLHFRADRPRSLRLQTEG